MIAALSGPRLSALAAALVLPLLLPACQVAYYGQAVKGHLEVTRKRVPVGHLLADPATDPALREQLSLTREILDFAERELLLPSGGNYSAYTDLKRDYVVWSVFAAPKLAVEPHSWRYPVLGKLDYRGYFSESSAERKAASLRQKGLDSVVVGVPAYSTLGFSRDPLLNTFIDYPETRLAGLIFHELAHKKYYRHGDTAFSEAFAVAVEEEGVARWLASRGEPKDRAAYHRSRLKLREFVDRVLATRESLRALYESPLPDDEKRLAKTEMLEDLRTFVYASLTAAGRTAEDSIWLRGPLSNAHLNVVAAYFDQVPRFEECFVEAGGDMARFYEIAAALP